jgi:hypothetical protein
MELIDIKTIEELNKTVQELLNNIYKLDTILQEKLKDQKAIILRRNIFGFIACIGAAVFSICVGKACYSTSGFTKTLKNNLIRAGSITVIAAPSAIVAHFAQYISKMELIIMNFKEIRIILSQLGRNFTRIKAISQNLLDEDGTKQMLMKLLKDTQDEVNKGFEILKQL